MSNASFASWRSGSLQASSNMALTGTVKVIGIDSADDTLNVSTDDYFNDVASAARVGTATLASKTYTGGTFDAADATMTSVTGDQFEQLLFYVDSGTESTSPLVFLFDTATGLPCTPNGGNINLAFNASGIYAWST